MNKQHPPHQAKDFPPLAAYLHITDKSGKATHPNWSSHHEWFGQGLIILIMWIRIIFKPSTFTVTVIICIFLVCCYTQQYPLSPATKPVIQSFNTDPVPTDLPSPYIRRPSTADNAKVALADTCHAHLVSQSCQIQTHIEKQQHKQNLLWTTSNQTDIHLVGLQWIKF